MTTQTTKNKAFFVHEKPNQNHFMPSWGKPIDVCFKETKKAALAWFISKYEDGSQGTGIYVLTDKDMSL